MSRDITFHVQRDLATGKVKIYGYGPNNKAAWVWSSFVEPVHTTSVTFIPRWGLLGWLGFERPIRCSLLDIEAVEREYERCRSNDHARLRDILSGEETK